MDHKIDTEELEITFPVASSEPYPRMGTQGRYDECLVISPDAVNMERLNGGASVLKNHDPDHILGAVKRAWIESGKLLVQCAFRKNDSESAAIFRDIADGTMRNVSIGYVQDEVSFRKVGDRLIGDVVRWTPLEVSVAVGVPADPTVGFFRSFELKKGGESMPEEQKNETPVETPETPAVEERKATKPEIKPEIPVARKETEFKTDSVIIRHICEVFDCPEKAEDAIKRGLKPEELKAELKESLNPKTEIKSIVNHNPKGITKMAQRTFSTVNALRHLLTGKGGEFEIEVSEQMYKKYGVPQSAERSIMIPLQRSDAEETGFGIEAGNAAALLGTDYRPDLFVDIIRARVENLGAQFVPGLVGNMNIPVQTGTGSVTWVSTLNSDVTESNPTIGSITLSPKKLGAFTKIQKDAIVQGIPSPVNLAISDLMKLISMKLSYTMLKGNANPAITGLDAATGVRTVTIGSITSATFNQMLEFDAAVGDLALDDNKKRFIMRAGTLQKLKGISKDTGSGRYICEDGMIDGYPVAVDGQIGDDDIFFGDFSNILVGQWGGLELMVDPYKWARSGQVEVIATLIADIAIKNPASFVKRVASVSA